jgi:uncharacterized repeat protein (TIGR01451 family)
LDAAFYEQDTLYPGAPATLDAVKTLRGVDVTAVRLYPYQYNPARREMTAYSHLRVRVRFSGGTGTFADARHRADAFEALYRRLLLNYEQLGAPAAPAPQGANGAEFLIITPPDFVSAANALASWRNSTGVDTEVRTTADTGTTASAIQAYIQNAYDTWTPAPSFVMFLGDAEYIPTHYVTEHPYHNTKTGTDLYYATVDGSDYYPDIHTGRISVDTAAEATKAINDIIDYDRNPVTDEDFYANASVAAYFQDNDDDGYEDRRFVLTSEEMRDFLMAEGYTVERIYYTPSSVDPTHYNNGYYANGAPINPELLRANGFAWDGDAADINAAIAAGRFLITHRDHGARWGWGDPYYTTNHVQALTNGNKLPVVLSMNCQTGWFDNETDEEGGSTPDSEIYFSEAWQRNPNGGGVGVIGATRVSYSGNNDWMTEGFIDAIWPSFLSYSNPDYAQPERRMGAVLNYGKLVMEAIWGDPWGVQKIEFEMFHYFGDPTMAIHTTLPNPDVPWLSVDPISVTVPMSDSVAVAVTLDAGAVEDPGTYTAQVRVASNDPDTPEVSVPVTFTVRPVGVVQGAVYDARTGDPLEATVTIAGGVPVTQTTADPASGTYAVALEALAYDVTAAASGYVSKTHSVALSHAVTTTQDFALTPIAPWIEPLPNPVRATVRLSDTLTDVLTVHNHGPRPLTFSLCEAATAGGCSDVAWLDVQASGGAVDGYASAPVTYTLDTLATPGLGRYTAYLRIVSDDPATPVIEVPVQFKVRPWQPLLSIEKSASADAVQAGSLLTYTLTVENTGDIPATGMTITDTVPEDTSFVSAEGGGQLTGGEVRWTGLTLPVGDSATARFTVQVDSPLPDGAQLANVDYGVRCAEGVSATNAPLQTTVRSAPELHIAGVAAPDPVQPGGLLTYTLTVQNTGNANATGVNIGNAVPADTTFVSAEGGGFVLNGVVRWNNQKVPAGTQVTRQFTVRVDPDLPDGATITNASYGVVCGQGAHATGTPFTTAVQEMPRLALTGSATPDPVEAGGRLTYALTVENTGGLAATGVVITDAIPAHTAFVAASDGGTEDAGEVRWDIGSLDVDEARTVTLTVQVDRLLADGTVLHKEGGRARSAEGVGATGSAITTLVHSAPAFDVTLAAAPSPVEAGGRLTYTLTVRNTGGVTATGVVVTDAVPAHTAFVAASDGGTEDAGEVQWALGSLDVDAARTVTLAVQVDAPLADGTELRNGGARVHSAEGVAATGPAVTTPVHSAPAFDVILAAAPDPVEAGGLLTYTLTVHNVGNADATGVTVTLELPAHTDFVAADQAGAFVEDRVSWTGHTIGMDARLRVRLTVHVDAAMGPGTAITGGACSVTSAEGVVVQDENGVEVQVTGDRWEIYLPAMGRR